MSNVEKFGDWEVRDDALWFVPNSIRLTPDVFGQLIENKILSVAGHYLDKIWVNPEEFVPALKRALERHRPELMSFWPETPKSIQISAYVAICAEEAQRRLGLERRTSLTLGETSKIGIEASLLARCARRPRAEFPKIQADPPPDSGDQDE